MDSKSLSISELENIASENSFQKYRVKQLYKWLQIGITNYDQMSNIPQNVKQYFKDNYTLYNCEIVNKLVSKIDGTVKYLYKLNDNEIIETVVMRYKHGHSICISTQVGCKMGCDFCASTKGGLKRNLEVGELLSQITTAQDDLGIKVSNIVMMGIGEPLDNFDNVIKFLELVTSDEGQNIGMRHISLSTCGMVDEIYRLAELQLQCTLSVSLHSPTDELRSKFMPINLKYNLNDLIKSCKYYIQKTSRRISFEYVLIENVNDDIKCAEELVKLLRGTMCHVNLIPINNINERDYAASTKITVDKFCNYLNDRGINSTVRRTLGSDITASCGQLRQNALGAIE